VSPALSWRDVSVPSEWDHVALNATRLVVFLEGVPEYDLISPDEFVLSLGLDSPATTSLLACLQAADDAASSAAPTSAFETSVRPLLTRHALLLLNATAPRVVLPAAPAYILSAPETIVLNLNATDASVGGSVAAVLCVFVEGVLRHEPGGPLRVALQPVVLL